MVTMLLGGLWHGAALRFVIWGGLHGTGLVFDRLRQAVFGEGGRRYKWLIRLTGIIITFNFVNFCWIFFRAETMNDALIMIRQMLHNFSPGSYLEVLPAYATVFTLIVTGYIIQFLPEEIRESYRALFIKIPVAAQMFIILIIAAALFQLRTTGAMPFIYFRF
jgi:D-alanyl-lipoteichoic acid acyltransferase DltB (MBOAT superfamily)